MILKEKIFIGDKATSAQVAVFANSNKIKREDILIITQSVSDRNVWFFTIFYYAEQ